jgi:Cu+-exporting ATPase
MKNKTFTIFVVSSLAIGFGLIILALVAGGKNTSGTISEPVKDVVSVVDGKQIIEISAKGGYSPRRITAKADLPTVIRVKTKGTFDCSASFTIPSLKIGKLLPASGTTDFEIPGQKAGSELDGMCSMGMYGFKIAFE